MTHTYVTLELTENAYQEIRSALLKAGYSHAFNGEVIDMHGLAVIPPPCPTSSPLTVKPGNAV
jgi:hypothetical protein